MASKLNKKRYWDEVGMNAQGLFVTSAQFQHCNGSAVALHWAQLKSN